MPQTAGLITQDIGYARSAAVVPSDTVAIGPCKALYIGVTGNVAVTMPGAVAASYAAVPAGTYLPIAPTHVKATGTTATGIMRWW